MNLKRVLYWSLPSLVCLVLYWHGLKAWFQMDDFAWLSLHTLVSDFDSLLTTLFRPMAQGTVRPLSERLFFLAFWELFGMEALPYRAVVFGTQFLNLVLITAITRRLTGSNAAGFLAPILWLVCPILYEPLVWTSAYNQILCAFFLLLEFYLLLRYVDTGRRRYYGALWIAFLLGFGALELNVVFPAIATVYLLLQGWRYVWQIAPMFLVSGVYTLWHRSVGRGFRSPIYAMDFHPQSVLFVLSQYVEMALSASIMGQIHPESKLPLQNSGVVVLIALVVFIGLMLWRRQWLVLFFLAWFGITLGPYLPLANHISDYYLTIPMIGLSMLGAWATTIAWRGNTATRLTAIFALLCFAIPGAWQARQMTRRLADKSRAVRHLVRSVAAAHKLHPNKAIVLKGVDNDLFWAGLHDRPQLALGWSGLYLTGDSERNILPSAGGESIANRFLPEIVTLQGIKSRRAVVYDVSSTQLRNVTQPYQSVLTLEKLPLPHIVDAGVPLYAGYLKEGWYEQGPGYAWMAKRATVEMRGPAGVGGKLQFHALLTPLHTQGGPLTVNVLVDGRLLGSRPIAVGTADFSPTFDLPNDLVGKPSIQVTVEVDRTLLAPPDPRPLGLLFGTFEVSP